MGASEGSKKFIHVVSQHRFVAHLIFDLCFSLLLGGVVTFTPQALLEGHCYASRLMEKLHEHPLWSSYIIPLTLGILVGMSEREQDTNEHATR